MTDELKIERDGTTGDAYVELPRSKGGCSVQVVVRARLGSVVLRVRTPADPEPLESPEIAEELLEPLMRALEIAGREAERWRQAEKERREAESARRESHWNDHLDESLDSIAEEARVFLGLDPTDR